VHRQSRLAEHSVLAGGDALDQAMRQEGVVDGSRSEAQPRDPHGNRRSTTPQHALNFLSDGKRKHGP
jgi:hypothetical protein